MKRMTKTARRAKARKASVERRVATALATFLKRANPGMKTAGAKVQKLKGGVLKITPIKANASIRADKKAMKKSGLYHGMTPMGRGITGRQRTFKKGRG